VRVCLPDLADTVPAVFVGMISVPAFKSDIFIVSEAAP
jgi:hypothetical protein